MSSTAASSVATTTRVRARVQTTTTLLGALIVVSVLARFSLSFNRESPRYLPDEFLYGQLGRSLGTGDGMQILGEPTIFPALLEPLVTALLWRSGDAELAYRSVQALHAVLMSLAAIPVFVLARRLGLSDRAGLAAAAVTLVAPGMLYVGYATADALGLLLALIALDAGVRVLARPSRSAEAGFLLAAGLATFARMQYAVLFLAFALAAIAVERGHLRRVARRIPLTTAVLGIGTAALVVGPSLLGRYESVASFGVSTATGRWTLSNVFLVGVCAGAATIPAAVAWIALRIVRPTTPERTAFAALGGATVLGLVVASALMATETGSDRFFERYLLVAAPVVALAFAAWVAERRPAGRAAALIGVILLAGVAAVPLSGYAVGQGRADSPTLLAVGTLTESIGTANASLVAAIAFSLSALVGIAVALVPRIPAWPAVAVAVTLFVVVSVGAQLADGRASRSFLERTFDGRPDWVQATGARDVLLVQTPWSGRLNAMITTLWNPGITDVTSVGDDIDPVDGLGAASELLPDGTLAEDGLVVERPLLFASYGTTVEFDESVTTTRGRLFTLGVSAEGPTRLASFAGGIRPNGSVAARGRLTAFPTPAGGCRMLSVLVGVRPGLPPITLVLRRDGEAPRRLVVRQGSPVTFRATSAHNTPSTLEYTVVMVGPHRVVPSAQLVVLEHAPPITKTVSCGGADGA